MESVFVRMLVILLHFNPVPGLILEVLELDQVNLF